MSAHAPAVSEQLASIRQRIRARAATAQDFLAYDLLRGLPAVRGFSPRTNPKHLANGRSPFEGFLRACQSGWLVDPELPSSLSEMLPATLLSVLRQEKVRLWCDTFRRAQLAGLPRQQLVGLLRKAMLATPQGRSNVWEHCRRTEKAAMALLAAQQLADPTQRARRAAPWMPAWYVESECLRLSDSDAGLLRRYLRMHDCGKPFVYTEDEQARPHFHGHSAASARVWKELGGSLEECWLIEHDMTLPTLPAAGIDAFADAPLAKLQLVGAFASLAANEGDFGGCTTSGFRAKLKHLDRRGRALLLRWAARRLAASTEKPATTVAG